MQTDPLKELDKKLSEYQQKQDNSKPKPNQSSDGASFVVGEIVAGISIGSIIGYYLDQYLHTKVLFLLIFVILGLISSLYNIYKKYK